MLIYQKCIGHSFNNYHVSIWYIVSKQTFLCTLIFCFFRHLFYYEYYLLNVFISLLHQFWISPCELYHEYVVEWNCAHMTPPVNSSSCNPCALIVRVNTNLQTIALTNCPLNTCVEYNALVKYRNGSNRRTISILYLIKSVLRKPGEMTS